MRLGSTSTILQSFLILVGLALCVTPLSAVTVEFSQPSYTVRPGDSIDITVRLSDPVPNGLEGYALQLGFPAGLLAVNAISVVPQLDFDLFETGALRDAGGDFASIAGFVEFGQPAYTGTDFVIFSVTVSKAAAEGPVVLNLSGLLDNAVNFVDGLGNSIDESLTFGTATLDILPPWPEEYLDDIRVDIEAGQTVIRFSGIPGRSYLIQYSNSLSERSWLTLKTVDAPGDGRVEVMDSLTGGSRFYRVVSP